MVDCTECTIPAAVNTAEIGVGACFAFTQWSVAEDVRPQPNTYAAICDEEGQKLLATLVTMPEPDESDAYVHLYRADVVPGIGDNELQIGEFQAKVPLSLLERQFPKCFEHLGFSPSSTSDGATGGGDPTEMFETLPDSTETDGDNARASDGIEIGDMLNSGDGEASASTKTGGSPFDDGIGFGTEPPSAAPGFFYDEEPSYGEHSRPSYGPHGIFAGTPHGDPLLMMAGMVETMLLQRKLEDLARAALTSSPISAMLDATTIATASARRGYVMIVIKNVGDDSTEAPQSNPASATDQSTTSRRSPRWPWNR